MGSTRAWTGASQSGNFPAWCSISTAIWRSIEPRMARCSITGVCLRPSWPVYSRPKRSGMEKSTWIVPHCQVRPMASVTWNSIFGP